MRDPKDIISLGTGMMTAGVGGLGITVGDVQVLLSIVASGSGIILTLGTLYWRFSEHQRLMRKAEEEKDAENGEERA